MSAATASAARARAVAAKSRDGGARRNLGLSRPRRLLSAGASPPVCLSFAGWLLHRLLSRASASRHLLSRSRLTRPATARRAVAIIVDFVVRRAIAIVVGIVVRRAIAIVVDVIVRPAVAIVVVDVIVRRAVTIVNDIVVRRAVAIIVNFVAHRAVAIVVDIVVRCVVVVVIVARRVVMVAVMLHYWMYLGTYIGTYLQYSLDPNFYFQPTVLARSHLITL
jgi:hypothetical protein